MGGGKEIEESSNRYKNCTKKVKISTSNLVPPHKCLKKILILSIKNIENKTVRSSRSARDALLPSLLA